jgi:hypothetical protein
MLQCTTCTVKISDDHVPSSKYLTVPRAIGADANRQRFACGGRFLRPANFFGFLQDPSLKRYRGADVLPAGRGPLGIGLRFSPKAVLELKEFGSARFWCGYASRLRVWRTSKSGRLKRTATLVLGNFLELLSFQEPPRNTKRTEGRAEQHYCGATVRDRGPSLVKEDPPGEGIP